MRLLFAVTFAALVGLAMPAAADNRDNQSLLARCTRASFARRPPGVLSSTMRNAEIKRCVSNNGFLD